MSKTKATSSRGASAVRDRSQTANTLGVKREGNTVRLDPKRKDSSPFRGVRREVLFPTEPSTIGNSKIDRAVEIVISRRK
jgi:hypothetical protein